MTQQQYDTTTKGHNNKRTQQQKDTATKGHNNATQHNSNIIRHSNNVTQRLPHSNNRYSGLAFKIRQSIDWEMAHNMEMGNYIKASVNSYSV